MLLFASLLLVMGAIASAISPRERSATTPPRATPETAVANPATAPRRVDATLPGKPVRVRVGDIVTLHVAAPGPDQVAIPDLGLFEPADKDLPAQFDLVANAPGSYPVVLGLSGRRVGVLEVAKR